MKLLKKRLLTKKSNLESIDKSKPYMQTSSEYDSTGNYVTSEINEQGSTAKYSYDTNGNPLSYRDGMSFEWENGRILKNINTSDKAVQMSYDSNGMRTQKSVDGVKTNYYYDSNKNLIALVKGNDTLLFYYDSDGSATSFSYNGTMYFYVKNLQGDVIRIIDLAGTEVASYVYDAWGNIKDTKGEPTIREINPIRYRSYVYNTETSLYYLQSRYYDPFAGRFLNADIYCDTGTDTTLSTNMFAYCENNPISNYDASGQVIETVLDIASAIWSLVDLISAPSWLNLGFFIWDVVAAIVPFVPGSYVAKGGKLAVKVASKISDFSKGKKYITGAYRGLKKVFKGKKGIEIHHLVEKRFSKLFKKVKTDDFLSVPLSKELHRTITNRWRNCFPYGTNYSKITKTQMRNAIKKVYKDMPQLLNETLKWFEKNWKK